MNQLQPMASLRQYSARERLLLALCDIFAERWKFIDVVRACCAAQRELAAMPDLTASVRAQGWIVGKADDHNT